MREWKRKELRASACDCSNVNNVEEDGSNVNGDRNKEKDVSEGDDFRGRTTQGLDGDDEEEEEQNGNGDVVDKVNDNDDDDDVPLLVPS